MNGHAKVDSVEWAKAIGELSALQKKTQAEVVNQAALDVAGFAFDSIPPADINASRRSIRANLTQILAQKVKLMSRGINKGKFRPVGGRQFTTERSHGKDRQLRRVHKMINAAMKRRGKPGLYGKRMRAYASAVVGNRTKGVGFLKGVFVPVFVTLNQLVQFKFPFSKTRNIARWPGSAAFGIVNPARPGEIVSANMLIAPTIHGTKQDSKITALYRTVLSAGIQWKLGKMQREVERRLEKIYNKASGR